jgi:hypothetical protein
MNLSKMKVISDQCDQLAVEEAGHLLDAYQALGISGDKIAPGGGVIK